MQTEMATRISRVEQLRSRVTEMYRVGVNFAELGNTALELLALRNEIESQSPEIPGDTSKKLLSTLRDLEKTIISLYMLGRLSERRPRKLGDYGHREYAIFER